MAGTAGMKGNPLAQSAVASDAFFPFADGLIAAADAGVSAVIQPGGSIRDEDAVAAADERIDHGIYRHAAFPALSSYPYLCISLFLNRSLSSRI